MTEWKRLKTLPEEFDAQKQRIAMLEARVAELAAMPACPKCWKRTYAVVFSEPDPVMGDLGANRRTRLCSACGFTEKKSDL